ncbi:protein-lysine N-methyltransferase [Saccharomycopsis crataegensis]|uniref:Protein-lysine N-methyltransferase n=1 Tax=Saccharomycopsis crataegensis TaxID=43959 RepID=A0AAV5QH45_9ASCO|nr:protein-lysine N-methyltransferase [Saccharomycopsis crataegensis]
MDTNGLLLWLRENDPEAKSNLKFSSKLQVQYFESSGYGLYYNSSTQFSPRELLISLPKSLLINYLSCSKHILSYKGSQDCFLFNSLDYNSIKLPGSLENDEFSRNIYSKLEASDLYALSSFQLVTFYLVIESQRKSSFWSPFLQVLPKLPTFYGIPLTWEICNLEFSIDGDNLDKINNHKDIDDCGVLSDIENSNLLMKNPLISLLPFSMQIHVKKQYYKFKNDYQTIISLIKKRCTLSQTEIQDIIPMEKFLWSWLCINSRCLYMELPSKFDNKTIDDNFTLCPLVDFINHCDDSHSNSSSIKIDKSSFSVFTSGENPNYRTSNEEIQELYFSYGAHSNAFLFAEYGFILSDSNKWETVDISENISEMLDDEKTKYLESIGYFNDYSINHESISFRTTVALSLISNSDAKDPFRKINFLINGTIDETEFEKKK